MVDSESSGVSERMDFLVDSQPLPDESWRNRWIRIVAPVADGRSGVLSERELRIVRERRLSETLVTLESLGDELGISKSACAKSRTARSELRRALAQQSGCHD